MTITTMDAMMETMLMGMDAHGWALLSLVGGVIMVDLLGKQILAKLIDAGPYVEMDFELV